MNTSSPVDVDQNCYLGRMFQKRLSGSLFSATMLKMSKKEERMYVTYTEASYFGVL